eukprot:CAMPEP_0182579464 /NCGR_PEP_ID=MMETSP1324-20130603/44241_1 /TAXON_ID=236786 /ORGANISM="Florenciella sp., Strain RCC1587" /LENGTH=36 /DNA_ID= /DNA_START= /DNA_END= /DNA_ORIENTATION=
MPSSVGIDEESLLECTLGVFFMLPTSVGIEEVSQLP